MLNFIPSSHDESVRLWIGKQSTLDILTKFRIGNGFYRCWRVEKAKEEHWSNTDNHYRKQQPPVGLGDQRRAWSSKPLEEVTAWMLLILLGVSENTGGCRWD